MVKRTLLTDGYAEPVYLLAKQVAQEHLAQDFGLQKGRYVVNISFDLEYSLNTYFWNHDFRKAEEMGKRAKNDFAPTLELLAREGIESNVQIVGMLLDSTAAQSTIFSDTQRQFIDAQPELFSLTSDEISLVHESGVEVGIHGYTHRLFADIDTKEAVDEVVRAVGLARDVFCLKDDQRLFMSYPRNVVVHAPTLLQNGIYAYRSNTQILQNTFEIPRGLWFSASTLNAHSISRLLTHIRNHTENYVLHFWGHFTEMDTDTLQKLIASVRHAGWEFGTIQQIKERV